MKLLACIYLNTLDCLVITLLVLLCLRPLYVIENYRLTKIFKCFSNSSFLLVHHSLKTCFILCLCPTAINVPCVRIQWMRFPVCASPRCHVWHSRHKALAGTGDWHSITWISSPTNSTAFGKLMMWHLWPSQLLSHFWKEPDLFCCSFIMQFITNKAEYTLENSAWVEQKLYVDDRPFVVHWKKMHKWFKTCLN